MLAEAVLTVAVPKTVPAVGVEPMAAVNVVAVGVVATVHVPL